MLKPTPMKQCHIDALVTNLTAALDFAKNAQTFNKQGERRDTEESIIRVRRAIAFASVDLDRA